MQQLIVLSGSLGILDQLNLARASTSFIDSLAVLFQYLYVYLQHIGPFQKSQGSLPGSIKEPYRLSLSDSQRAFDIYPLL